MLNRSMVSAIEACWSSSSLAAAARNLADRIRVPAPIQIGGCGFCAVGGSTMMFSKRQNLPWCEKRCSEVQDFRMTSSPSSKRSSASPGDAEAREFVVAVALADAEIEPPAGQNRWWQLARRADRLCQGSTITAVPSRSVLVRAAEIRRLRLAETCRTR